MKKILLTCSMLLTLAARAADAPPPKAGSPLAPLTPLAGGLWIGSDLTPAKDGAPALHIELRMAWTENRQGLRFDSTFVQGDKRRPYTSGLYAWDAARQKIIILYVDGEGSLTQGTVTPEGDTLVHELTVTEASAKTYPVLVRLQKSGPDVFINNILLQKDGKWAPFVSVRYERKQ